MLKQCAIHRFWSWSVKEHKAVMAKVQADRERLKNLLKEAERLDG